VKLVIVHGGQTGVDRGAFWGALDGGLDQTGWMPKNQRDEKGPIPDHVARFLTRCTVGSRDGGYPARTAANVELANAVLLVVADHANIKATRGTALTHSYANDDRYGRPWLAVDSGTPMKTLRDWLAARYDEHDGHVFKLMVAGPRASSWSSGEALARQLVACLGSASWCYVPAGGGFDLPASSGPDPFAGGDDGGEG